MGAELSGRTTLSRRGFVLAGLACFAGSAAAQCRRTPADALGPSSYYMPGQPLQADLCQRDASAGIRVTGRVLGFPECRPVVGALVEVWHADVRGVYSRTDKIVGDDLACLLRASIRASDDGRYSFRTLPPGTHFGQPPCIHFRVSAPGYRTLVTRMYLPRQEGLYPHLLARPADASAAAFEFDLTIAPR